jgi:hypothetical protein
MTTSSWDCYLSLSNHVAPSCLSSPLTGNLSVFYVCQLPLISHHGSWVCHHQVLFSFVFYNRRNIACWLDLMLSSLCTNTDYSLTSKNHLSHFRLFCQSSMRKRNVYIHVCNVQCLKHCLKQSSLEVQTFPIWNVNVIASWWHAFTRIMQVYIIIVHS